MSEWWKVSAIMVVRFIVVLLTATGKWVLYLTRKGRA